jgi:ubiquinol-cytochrome c reductase cytochrome b subunit
MRTQYDKFVTGLLWPLLFIISFVLIPFIDRYKKFSWRDRPIITAFGITSLAQIMVTTYWGFYISPDTKMPLVERLVIDPIFFYSTMILLVPLGFGFTYMMIKLANEAERKSKLAKSNGPQKVATINLSEKWINWLLVALLAFQVFLNIAAYNAALTGMKNVSLFFIGLAEPEVSVEQSKLPEGEKTSDAKELAPEVQVPKTQADMRVGASDNSNIGSNDLDGVKK